MKKRLNAALLTLLVSSYTPHAIAYGQAGSSSVDSTIQMPESADAARLLTVQGVLNARNFSSLQGARGPVPASSFIRTADLSKITPLGRNALAAAGVTLDIDLRTAEEQKTSRDLLADDPRFKYERISLLGTEKIDPASLPSSLGSMYVNFLADNQAQFAQVFKKMAQQKDGTILFHCAAGKDRTGMIAALLLALAGVPESDIVHNYAISADYLKPIMASPEMVEMLKANPKVAALSGTPPEAIVAFLDVLNSQHGGAHTYLKSIGLDDSDVQNLLQRMGQAG